MSGDITMVQVVETLREVYTDEGVAIWLGSANAHFDGERAIDICRTAEGRLRVWQIAGGLAEGAFA